MPVDTVPSHWQIIGASGLVVICVTHVAGEPAREVRRVLREFRAAHGTAPKVILLENHGPVALGASEKEVLNTLLMVDKWARVLAGTLAVGTPKFLPSAVSERIDQRPDEHYRRAQIVKGPA